jgi:LuxR family maltose regulon positive regulatory protein
VPHSWTARRPRRNWRRAADLRFSREETEAFFGAADALGLSDARIATLHGKTEGWITGQRLALLSLAGEADPEARVRAFSTTSQADILRRNLFHKALGLERIDALCARLRAAGSI